MKDVSHVEKPTKNFFVHSHNLMLPPVPFSAADSSFLQKTGNTVHDLPST